MPRKSNENNPLQIKIKVNSLPRNVSPKRFNQRLLDVIDEGADLPSSWDVEIFWRNPKTRHGLTKRWRSDDFVSAIFESRSGFVSIIRSALVRRLRKL